MLLGDLNTEWPSGYAPVFYPPSRETAARLEGVGYPEGTIIVKVDYGRLLLQITVAIALAGAGVLIVKR